MSRSSSPSAQKEEGLGSTYPVPSRLYESLTGFRQVNHDDLVGLGDETEVIRLEIPEANIKDVIHVLINDVLHDSEGARSAKGTRLSDHFNSKIKKGEEGVENGLNQLIETYLYGMNCFYENPALDALRLPADACRPLEVAKGKKRARGAEEDEGEGEGEDLDGGGVRTRGADKARAEETSPASRALPASRTASAARAAPARITRASAKPAQQMESAKPMESVPPTEQTKAVPKAKKSVAQPAKPTQPEEKMGLEKSLACDLITTYYKGARHLNIHSVHESKELKLATQRIKQAVYRTKEGTTTKAIYTNYATEDVLRSEKPYLVSYDAGSDLLNSILGQYDYVDISIVNVKDPGDSMRNRNKLLTSIEKILYQYPSVEWSSLVLQLKAQTRVLPKALRAATLAFLETCQRPMIHNIIDPNATYFHAYATTRVSECLKNQCLTKNATPNVVLNIPIQPKHVYQDYMTYAHHKFNAMLGKERFVIHRKNVRLVLYAGAGAPGGAEFKLLDVLYYFDATGRMRVRFNPGGPQAEHALAKGAYDRPNLNSARDVGLNIKTMNEKLGGILGLLHGFLKDPMRSIQDFGAGGGDGPGDAEKIAMTLYLECMYKFIGDFGQVLYCFYLGSVFASFDSSAITVALTIMNILIRNPRNYKAFKEGQVQRGAGGAVERPGSGYEERLARGLILVSSTKYHGKGVPQVSYFTDYYASRNIQRGVVRTPEERRASLIQYFKEIQVERFDDSLAKDLVGPGAAAAAAVRRTQPQPQTLALFERTVAVGDERVYAREEKHRLLEMVEKQDADEIKSLLLPKLLDSLTEAAPELVLWKTVKNAEEKYEGGVYVAGPGLDLWSVVERKVIAYLERMGAIHAKRNQYVARLVMTQLRDMRAPKKKARLALLAAATKGVSGPWIFIQDDKRYLNADYLLFYKRYVKRVFIDLLGNLDDPERRRRYYEVVHSWYYDALHHLPNAKDRARVLVVVEPFQNATIQLEDGQEAALETLKELFGMVGPVKKPPAKKTKMV